MTSGTTTLYHARMEDILPSLRFDRILTDPPYGYLQNQNFDREFDEALLFETMKRVMPDNGFAALFGRGTSFYRWNNSLAELEFVFKEELIWDKRRTTSPCMALSRVHETMSLFTKKPGNCGVPRCLMRR
jgi:site-specific DNA-methyltransferase (adenine-specific)